MTTALPLRLSFPLAALLLLAGCNDPKEASIKNFTAATQKMLDAAAQKNAPVRALCLNVNVNEANLERNSLITSFRYTQSSERQERDRFERDPEFKLLKALADAGHLTPEVNSTQKRGFFGGQQTVETHEFTVAANSGLTTSIDHDRFFGVRGASLCGGRPELVEVTRFTEPTDTPMGRVANLDVRFKIADVPPAFSSPAVAQYNESFAARIALPHKANLMAALMNDGWEVEPLKTRMLSPIRDPSP